jgi:hypothetical protein
VYPAAYDTGTGYPKQAGIIGRISGGSLVLNATLGCINLFCVRRKEEPVQGRETWSRIVVRIVPHGLMISSRYSYSLRSAIYSNIRH